MRIAIPTYRHAEKFKTLKFLELQGQKRSNTFIFFHGEKEYFSYKNNNDLSGYNCIINDLSGETGQKNKMLEVMKKPFLMLDDDIYDFYVMKHNRWEKKRMDFIERIAERFLIAESMSANIFGFNKFSNDVFARGSSKTVFNKFFCLEARADERLHKRYKEMSDVLGFDIWDFYKRLSRGAGYRRLNYNIKRPYYEKMEALCKKIGLRFYVSDAHGKEYCEGVCCCGLSEKWNYSRGQFTEALNIAKKNGVVYFKDIEKDILIFKNILWNRAENFNTGTVAQRAKRQYQSLYDYIRGIWNTPNSLRSPYKYFEGVLHPEGLDEDNNVIYIYKGGKK